MTEEPFANPYRDPAIGDETDFPPADPLDETSIEGTDTAAMSYTAAGSAPSNASDSTSDVAKDQAAQVSQGAADAGKRVAGVAKDQAGTVVNETKAQARNLAEQARSEAQVQAHTQKQRVSDGLRTLGQELGSMADGSEQKGTATDLARQASQVAHDAASWLEQRDPGDLLEEVRRFARRRPGAFLGIAAAAGVVAGRLTRGMTSSNDSNDSNDSADWGSASAAPSATQGSASASGWSGETGTGAAGYSAPSYGTTATGATYASGDETSIEYPGSYPEGGAESGAADDVVVVETVAVVDDYPVEDETSDREVR